MQRSCLGFYERHKKIIGAALLLLVAVSVVKGFVNGLNFIDFHWESAALFLRGENPYQWFFDGRYYQGARVDAAQAPSTIAFILPYGLFSQFVGNLLWDVSNLVFAAVFLVLIWKLWFKDSPWTAGLVAVVFLVGASWRNCIGNGQHVMFSLVFFMLAYFALEKKWSKWLVGVLMAASLFKYTVTVPMAFVFLFRREWKAMFVCAGVHVALTCLLGWWTGCNPLMLVKQSMQIGAALNSACGDADLAAFMSALGVWEVKPYELAGYVVGVIFLFAYALTGKKRDALLTLSTLAVVANVMFYHRIYDFVTLVFPLVYVLRHWESRSRLDRAVRVLVVSNVAWTFFVYRAFFALGWFDCRVPVTFVLEHLLLGALILRSYMGEEVDEVKG